MIAGIIFLIATIILLMVMLVLGCCKVAHESDIATEREIKDTDRDINEV